MNFLFFFVVVLKHFPNKIPVKESSQKGHSCKIGGPGGEDPEATSPHSAEVGPGRIQLQCQGRVATYQCMSVTFLNMQMAQLNVHHWLGAATMSLKWVQLHKWWLFGSNRFKNCGPFPERIRLKTYDQLASMSDMQQVDGECTPDVTDASSAKQLSCCFCGLSRWPGQIFTAWTKQQ